MFYFIERGKRTTKVWLTDLENDVAFIHRHSWLNRSLSVCVSISRLHRNIDLHKTIDTSNAGRIDRNRLWSKISSKSPKIHSLSDCRISFIFVNKYIMLFYFSGEMHFRRESRHRSHFFSHWHSQSQRRKWGPLFSFLFF